MVNTGLRDDKHHASAKGGSGGPSMQRSWDGRLGVHRLVLDGFETPDDMAEALGLAGLKVGIPCGSHEQIA